MITFWIISGIILLLGIGIFLYLTFGYKKKFSGVTHYEEIRDKLTLRKKKEPTAKLGVSDFIPGMLGNLLGGFIVIMVGICIIGPVIESVETATINNSSVSSFSSTVLESTPIIFTIAIMIGGISLFVGGMKNAGLM